MLYNFLCTSCDHEEQVWFLASDYDTNVENSRLKIKNCENCGAETLYRHITVDTMPKIMGGTKGYISMERWMKNNPDHSKRKEAELESTLQKRREKNRKDIDTQKYSQKGRKERNKGYKEDRIKFEE